ncbi:hypothetical protein OHT21_44160 [Streptomyces sp. NBC_00286]|nr:hypothetical protein [Streptomyces sp. NBC_00286]
MLRAGLEPLTALCLADTSRHGQFLGAAGAGFVTTYTDENAIAAPAITG